MRFALFHHVPWPSEAPQAQVLAELTEQVQLADELGFHCAWIAEHHFGRYGLASSSLLLAAHIAAHTRRIRLGTAITITTIRHPLMLAEEAAMLDVLSGGRLDFGIGSGADVELQAFGIDPAEGRARFAEVTDMVLGLWANPIYSHDGQFFHAHNLALAPRPLQSPHPPLYAAVRSDWGTQFALDRGMTPMTGVLPDTAAALEARRQQLALTGAGGFRADPKEMPFFRYVYVGESEEQIRADTEQHLAWVLDCIEWQRRAGGPLGSQSLDEWRESGRTPSTSYEDLYARRAFFGTPDRVRALIRELRDEHGVDYFGGNFSFGGLSQAKSLRSMELFAREVMPLL